MLYLYIFLFIAVSLLSIAAVTINNKSNFLWEIVYRITALILIITTLALCKRCESYIHYFIMVDYFLIQIVAYFIHQHFMEEENEELTVVTVFVYLEGLFHYVIHILILAPNFINALLYSLIAVTMIIEILFAQDVDSIFWRELVILMLFEVLVQGPIIYYILQKREL